jgi:hypothetical protein
MKDNKRHLLLHMTKENGKLPMHDGKFALTENSHTPQFWKEN